MAGRTNKTGKVKGEILPAHRILILVCFAFLIFVSLNSFAAEPTQFKQPKTLAELLALPPEQLEKVDIALVDLLSAGGLPGAENLDIEKCVKTLDEWAREVKVETERNYHRFAEHPEKFKGSLGRYRMAVMEAVLCQDLRVQYNPQREKELFENLYFNQAQPYGEAERSFTSDSSDWFLHGLLSDKRFGTCSSMPYLYVAVGRRLGYPVSIAGAHMHNYVYYDEGDGKHFNVEATENRGLFTPTDDEYRHPPWGAPSEADYYESRGLLRPMSNQFCLAHLLATRASIFRAHGRHDEEAKTWEIAAHYFPDTPTWKDIEKGMQKAAKFDDYQQWREGVWKELSAHIIPKGPGFAYFLDMKIKLYLFMNESLDRKAIEQAADEYKKELAEYSKTVMKLFDDVAASDRPIPALGPLYFQYHSPDDKVVSVPADFLPPFAHGELPVELQRLIIYFKPQDADTLLGMMWEYYGQMQATKLAKKKAELERIASGNPILISEESIPPEFRQGVPMELGIRLSGLHSAGDIVVEMWQYKGEQESRRQEIQRQEMLANPMAALGAALRQSGVPDSVARMSGFPVSDLSEVSGADRLRGMASLPGADPLGGIPALQAPAAQGIIPHQNGLTVGTPTSGPESWNQRAKQGNEQAMKIVEQYIRPQNDMKPGFALPYQIVPASAAANNPAVENPMPLLGSLPNSPLTPLPQLPITAPATKNNAP